jgi:hypothetical protein
VSHALDQGWPPPAVDGLLNAYAVMVTEPAPVTTTVEEITGTPARTFREWAIDHADDFRGGIRSLQRSRTSGHPSQSPRPDHHSPVIGRVHPVRRRRSRALCRPRETTHRDHTITMGDTQI